MKITVLDAETLGSGISLDPLSEFGELTVYHSTAPHELSERISDCDVIVTNKIKLRADVLAHAQNLKLICVTATGYDNIDTDFCREHGIGVCNVVGYSTDSVAQITVAMALSLANKLTEYRKFVSDGSYTASGKANRLEPTYREISAMTWGVIGLGNIGKKVAKIAEAIGCRVIANRRSGKDSEYECVSLDELLANSDIISIHTPLTAETRGIISRDKIAQMRDGAILVNVARGAVCDEAAIADAVLSGKLGGFGCDVYSVEPFGADHPYNKILDMENVILTPHMAWGAYEARVRCITEVAENIRSFNEGKNRCRIV